MTHQRTWITRTGLAIFLGIGIAVSAALAAVYTDPDLKSEDNALSLFGDGSVRYEKQLAENRKLTSLSLFQIDGLKSKGEGLNRQLPQAIQAIKSVIDKLKATEHWNRLDEEILDGTSNDIIAVLKKLGGPKQNLLDASQISANSFADEINTDIQALRAKAVSQNGDQLFLSPSGNDFWRMIPANYSPVAAKGFRCRLAGARYTISKLTHGGKATPAAASAALLNCPDPTL